MRYDDYPEETELVYFDRVNDRGAYGRTEDGVIVFVDVCSKVNVVLGERWHCKLLMNNKSSSKNYFAWPIEKIEENVQNIKASPTNDTAVKKQPEVTEPAVDDMGFFAIGNDMVISHVLTADRYSVYRNADGNLIEITADSKGDVPCVRHSLALAGFDKLAGNVFPQLLKSTVDNGRILINL